MIITIDGPVATGKSSIARRLAEYLGYIYFDTGAMYRAVAYSLMNKGVNIDDEQALKAFLDDFHFDIHMRHSEKHYFVGDEDVTDAIRSQSVTGAVSKISAKAAVREKLVAVQRKLAISVNAVFEGRDMGTVVFPDAALKIFLTGRPEVRAKRRLAELQRERPQEAAGLTMEQITQQIEERDQYDSTRDVSPLKKAPDAFEIDTSDLSIDELVFQILECKDQAKVRKK